jgi:hypothetical protein
MTVTGAQRLLPMFFALSVPAADAGVYDAPLQVRHVRLPSDPQNSKAKRQVSCFYYRSIVVKQVDYGELGSERLSLLPVVSGNGTPCRAASEANEYVIPSDSWSGYFKGVKSEYAFFDAPDGTNGGLGFMVMRVYGRRPLFEDTAQHGIESMDIHEGILRFRYRRVFEADCSLISTAPDCRERLIRDTGVSEASLSGCAQGYQEAKQTMAKARCAAHDRNEKTCLGEELALLDAQKWDQAPTVIVYEVEVSLNEEGPAISRRSDVLACRPSD